MRTIFLSFFIVFTGCIFSQSNKTEQQTSKKIPVVLACRGYGDLDFFVLSPSPDTGRLIVTERVILEVPTTSRKEYKSYWDGESIHFGSGPDGDCWTQFGQKAMYGGRLCFKQDGEQYAWLDYEDKIIYEDIEGKPVPIALTEHSRSYRSETGEELKTDMTKRMGKDEKWCFETDDGKVYLQEQDGKITQIGWQDWRVVAPPNGNKLLVVMTRGMDKNAKWQGKHNGKLYIEK
jgi:hypothetical protein